MKQVSTRRVAVSSVMVALATVLSLVTVFRMPSGGSVTLFSMLPICLLGYIYGVSWGMFSGLIFGIIQAITGGMSPSVLGGNVIIFLVMWVLDYYLAFSALGLAGSFKKINRYAAFPVGIVFASAVRFILHTISGSLIWELALIPSMVYNASYMIPECIITVIGGAAIMPLMPIINRFSADKTE